MKPNSEDKMKNINPSLSDYFISEKGDMIFSRLSRIAGEFSQILKQLKQDGLLTESLQLEVKKRYDEVVGMLEKYSNQFLGMKTTSNQDKQGGE